jgi:isopentenyl-diphosphate delta-isomerase
MGDADETTDRKVGHLDLFRQGHPTHGQERTTLLEQVELLPDPLPDFGLDDVDPSVHLLGRALEAPLILTGMTGGAEVAGEINQTLAKLAGEQGLGFGVGSQRAMLEDASLLPTYDVREAAGPDVLVLANIGIAQLPRLSPDRARWLVESIGADALCVHFNVAQELVQPEGDRQFAGAADALESLCAKLGRPVIAKEVGAGFGKAAACRLRDLGVSALDVAGAGGTSWTYAEALRGDERAKRLGETFRSWGIPTAAAVMQTAGVGLPVIASGGIRSGLDVVRAMALGASACGVAGPVIRALMNDGEDAARRMLGLIVEEVRVAMVLTGARTAADVSGRPRVIGPELARWSAAGGT